MEKVHGKPYIKEKDLVWFHSTVVSEGYGRRINRPWTGLFRSKMIG